MGADPPGEAVGTSVVVPGEVVGGFTIVRSLARGGDGEVFVAQDAQGGVCAFKVLHRAEPDPDPVPRLRRELRPLQRLRGAHVVGVDAWGLHNGHLWTAMPLIDGADLREVLPTWQKLPWAEREAHTRRVLLHLGRALASVHAQGLVHLDVSPGNVLIDNEGAAHLTDFGLMRDDQAGCSPDDADMMATIAHTAPERLLGGTVDARADLYALGTVLYLMLTGQKPFLAHTVVGWKEQHANVKPVPPRSVDPRVPEDLDQVCLRLLEKDPNLRFASALHLVRVLGDPEDVDDLSRWPPREVGRTVLSARIASLLEDVALGRPGAAMLLSGVSGIGKTRMLELAEREAGRLGLRVVRGLCRTHDRAYGPFATLYDRFGTAQIPSTLVRAFGGDTEPSRYRIGAAYRKLLGRAGPCVLIIDQVERAEAATSELIDYLIRTVVQADQAPIFLLMAAEAGDDVELAVAQGAERQALRRLLPLEVEELVATVVTDPDDARALAARIHEETQGLPAWTADVLRALVEQGVVSFDGVRGELTVSLSALADTTLLLPEVARRHLAERLNDLAPGALELARLLAVARDPTELDVLVAACSLPETELLAALDALVAGGVATERRQDGRDVVELAHARFRGVLLEPVPPEETRARHRALGLALEDRHRLAPSEVSEALASHFEEAQVPSKAYAYLAATAFLRMKSRLYEEALTFLDRAFAVEAEARLHLPLAEADRRRAELGVARTRALYHLGRWDDAEAAGREAEADAQRLRDPVLLAKVRTRLGYIQRTRGRLVESEALLNQALLDAGASQDPTLRPRPLYHLGAIAWARGERDQAEALWNEALETARAGEVPRAEGMALNGLGIVAASRGQLAEARRLWEIAIDLFRAVGMVDYRTFAEINLAELLMGSGALHRVGQIVEKALTRSVEVDHRLGICLARVTRARWMLAVGRPDGALHIAQEAARMAEAIGSPDEGVQASLVGASALQALGRPLEALTSARCAVDLLPDPDPDDLRPIAMAALAHALATAGAVEEAQTLLEAACPPARFPHVQVQVLLERARAHAALGHSEAVRTAAGEALAGAERLGQRLDALEAHHLLARVAPDAPAREVHVKKCRSLARAIAATLPRRESESFMRRPWGEGAVLGDGRGTPR